MAIDKFCRSIGCSLADCLVKEATDWENQMLARFWVSGSHASAMLAISHQLLRHIPEWCFPEWNWEGDDGSKLLIPIPIFKMLTLLVQFFFGMGRLKNAQNQGLSRINVVSSHGDVCVFFLVGFSHQGDQRGRYRGTCCSGDQAQRWPRTGGDGCVVCPHRLVVVGCLDVSCVKISRWMCWMCFFFPWKFRKSFPNNENRMGFENFHSICSRFLSQWWNLSQQDEDSTSWNYFSWLPSPAPFPTCQGSGFVFSSDGYIVTNDHVSPASEGQTAVGSCQSFWRITLFEWWFF